MARKIGCGVLYLHVMRDGSIRPDVEFSGDERALRALRHWIRDWPEHSLNECDHTPFVCADFDAESKRRPCGACAIRKALGLPPLKEVHPRAAPSAAVETREGEVHEKGK